MDDILKSVQIASEEYCNAPGVEAVFEIVRSCVTEFVGKYQEQCLYATIDHVKSYMEVILKIRKTPTKNGPPFCC